MNISFVRQYMVKFQLDGKKTHYKYDFYDEEKALVLETHGMQHFASGVFDKMGGKSLEQIKQTDKAKMRLAVSMGLRYIALDCRNSDANWIKREVIKKLDMYPLETIDWEIVRQDANRSVVLQIIKLYQEGYTQKQIGEMVHLHASTVCQKLQQATKDGLWSGISPRQLRAQENKKKAEEKQNRFSEIRQQREKQRKLIEERRLERLKNRGPASHEELLCEIRNRGLSFAVLDEYVNPKTYLRLLCTECQQVFRRLPKAILQDTACPYCKKLDEIKQRCFQKYQDAYEILGKYTDSKTPLHIRHNTCGKEFYITAQKFFKTGCPVCAAAFAVQRKQENSIKAFYALLPACEARGYTFAGDVCNGLSKPNVFLCNHCGETWLTTASSIVNGRNHICMSPCKKKTHHEYVKQVFELVGAEYSVLTEYQDAFTKVQMRHNLCGHTYMVSPVHFTSTGRRCPVCTKATAPEEIAFFKTRFSFSQNLYSDWEREKQIHGAQTPAYPDYLWNRKLEVVKEYYKTHGNIDIPYGFMVEGFHFGSWIQEQRKAYRLGHLQPYRMDALNALGMKWEYKEENWMLIYEKVKAYLHRNATLPLTKNSTKEERKLYYWLQDQTKLYRDEKLSGEKARLLEAIGVRRENKLDLRFDMMFEKLCEFKKLHGHCVVPLREGHDSAIRLGLWAQRMRQLLSSGQMPAERAARLKEIGFPANNKEAKFQLKLALAVSYRKEYGNLKIPQSYVKDGCRLGKWINSLRSRYGKGELSAAQIASLEAIGMIWTGQGKIV